MTRSEAAVFRGLYESYYADVYAYCRRRVPPDSVDDLVADVFLTAWRRVSDAPRGKGELPWLYRIAWNLAGNHWRGTRRQRKLVERLESIGIQSAPLLHDQVIVRAEVREVLAAAEYLRERDVEVLRLSLWEHLSSEDIGEVLGITANAAKQRLHRARNNLVREYERARKSAPHVAQKGGER